MAERSRLRRTASAARQAVRKFWRRMVMVPLHDWRYGGMPIAMITGSLGKTTTSRLLAAILKQQGHRVGLTCTEGIYVDGERICTGDSAGYISAGRLLRRNDITAAVLETARGGLINHGPFLRRGKVGALLNVAREHLGIDGIKTLDDMARLKAQVVHGSRFAVLNADDERCMKQAEKFDPAQLLLFSSSGLTPAMLNVVERGGRAVTRDADGWIVIFDGSDVAERLVPIAEVPVTLGGIADHYTANAMAATALALALEVPREDIVTGLKGFRGGRADNAGRWNVFEGYPFTFVTERGMNGSAFAATAKTIEAIPVEGKRIVLMTAVGNRTELQYEELASLAANVFDQFVIYDNVEYRRGRAPGEVPALLAEMLQRFGVAADRIETTPDAETGLARISAMVAPGDFVLMLQNQVRLERAIEQALAPHLLQ